MSSLSSCVWQKLWACLLVTGRHYSCWLGQFPIFGAELALLWAILLGLVGTDYGLKNLFWHEDVPTQILAGVSVALVALLLFFLSAVLDADASTRSARCGPFVRPNILEGRLGRVQRPESTSHTIPARRFRVTLFYLLVPIGLALLIPSLADLYQTARDGDSVTAWTFWALPLGFAGPLAVVYFILTRLAQRDCDLRLRRWHGICALVVLTAPILVLDWCGPSLGRGWITAAMTMGTLLTVIALLSFLTYQWRVRRVVMLIALLAIISYTNGFRDDKLRYPGLEIYTDPPRPVRVLPDSTAPVPTPVAWGAGPFPKPIPQDRLLDDLEQATKRNPRDAEARIRLGLARAKLADPVGSNRDVLNHAIADVSDALRLEPENARAYRMRSFLRYLQQDKTQGWSDIETAGRLDPGDISVSWDKIALLIANKDYRGALKQLESHIVRDMEDLIIISFARSECYLGLGEPDEAVQCANWIVERVKQEIHPHKKDVTLSYNGSWIDFLINEEYERKKAIRNSVQRDEVVFIRANLLLSLKRYDEAIQDYRSIADTMPLTSLLGCGLAALGKGGDLGQALTEFSALCRLRPNDPYPLNQRAQIYRRLGRADEAAADESQAERLRQGGASSELERVVEYQIKTAVESGTLRTNLLFQTKFAARAFGKSLGSIDVKHPPFAPIILDDRLDDKDVLNRWKLARGGTLKQRPKLVVVAVSGGGIAAAYWTALCLTEIERRVPSFPYQVRIITGASGGMVGAAHYVATLNKNSRTRTIHEICEDVAQDSLTPVVRQLVFRDLPSIFCPFSQSWDRGHELERTWEENTKQQLSVTLRSLLPGEAQGWRPSLIISPQIIEEGRPLLITNLRVTHLNAGRELADLLPAVTQFKLSTALRMNAAFPYVSPAVSLPSEPPLRIVDAGYLDNSGVGLAALWITRNRDWLQRSTSGVALVLIRAYPAPRLEGNGQSFRDRVWSGISFLTAPFEGYTSTKARLLEDRNKEFIARLKESFNSSDVAFFKEFEFEPTAQAQAPLSWNLARRDKDRLTKALNEKNNLEQYAKLVAFLEVARSIPNSNIKSHVYIDINSYYNDTKK